MKRAVSPRGHKLPTGGSISQACSGWLRLSGVGLVGSLAAVAIVNVARIPAWAQEESAASNQDTEASSGQLPTGQQTTSAPENEPTPSDEAALSEGKAMYRGLCSGCHGGAGRGGKGPDLTDDRWIHGNTDADIAKVIENGVPRTTMKKLGEDLTEDRIAKIIAYIRSLARPAGESSWQPYMAGDPALGEQVFFDEKGQALCSTCHTVNRKGGRIGPALDRIASRRSPPYIMESILLPSKDVSPLYEGVMAVTEDGRLISGLRVNETNFSLQIREQTGRFWSLMKHDLEDYRVLENSIMPENHAEQLTVKQLHDLFAFLMTLE